ncbi:uncharacterized protein LOC121736500 isoform X1 [Aricia agestis]|uniref:uncharacterized protein LOC121736500 isoform X1 n=1 Tax=Aricia agestis TaxID=91739 RepID=UPI001C20407E|nr:uncharacterized protein LOC121736500 isoform X1 [Aricia agestis]
MLVFLVYTHILLVKAFNDSNIIITRAGHSDIDRIIPEKITNKEEKQNIDQPIDSDVVFVPNSETRGNERHENYNINRVTERTIEKTVAEQSEQSKDVIFITGKNNEDVEKINKHTIQKQSETGRDVFVRGKEKHNDVVVQRKNMPLDCSNVICNNTLHSLCGERKDQGISKYRLFRNECYLRKVNCEFKDEFNRYVEVELEKCAKIAAHLPESPQEYVQNVPIITEEVRVPKRRINIKKQNKIRRSFKSRRSLSMGVDGRACQHDCPTYCTDVYVPECALSSSGQQKVFLNHCKLDLDSCLRDTVWYRRPLYECVGRKRTQVEQNREFIVWMQRSGLIDKKGKLIKS